MRLSAAGRDCGVRFAEFKDKNRRVESVAHSVKPKAPACAEAKAGRQSLRKDHSA